MCRCYKKNSWISFEHKDALPNHPIDDKLFEKQYFTVENLFSSRVVKDAFIKKLILQIFKMIFVGFDRYVIK